MGFKGDNGFTGGNGTALPYKVYTALLTQTGTDAPVAIILENTLGITASWTYVNTGYYRLVIVPPVFDLDKTVLIPPTNTYETFVNGITPYYALTCQYSKSGNMSINLTTGKIDGATGIITRVNGVMQGDTGDTDYAKARVEIRVYN
jgi:hypothetical protein